MKPIKLTLSGLNSYIEEQTIDFATLSSRGLFGIFGPTGCGKSTLLDGMTIALYGYEGIARSTKEFINTAVDKAYIRFEFELNGEEGRQRFIIERSIKRKGEGITTDYVRFQSFDQGGNGLELLDKTREVNERIVDLLGLTAADFTRSVVLPQGKFSDFLTLGGKERRDMLERILNLREYGGALTDKVRKSDRRLEKMEHLATGELERYADVTPETLKEQETLLEGQKATLEKSEGLWRDLTKKTQTLEQEFQWTQAFDQASRERKILEGQSEAIEAEEKNLHMAREAQKIVPILRQLQSTEQSLVKTTTSVKDLEKQESTQAQTRSRIQKQWLDHQDQWSQQQAWLVKEDLLLKQAKEASEKADGLQEKRLKLLDDYKREKISVKAHSEQLKTLVDQEGKLQEEMIALESWETAHTQETSSLKDLQAGAQLEQEHKRLREKEKEAFTAIQEVADKHKQVAANLKRQRDQGKWVRLEILNHEIEQLEKELGDLDKEVVQGQERLEQTRVHLAKSENQYQEWAKAREDNLRDTILQDLSLHLLDQTPCPLCGSEDHPHVYQARPVEQVDTVLGLSLEEDMQAARIAIEKLKLGLDQLEVRRGQIKELLVASDPLDREALANLRAHHGQRMNWREEGLLDRLEKDLQAQTILLSNTETTLDHRKKQVEEFRAEGQVCQEKLLVLRQGTALEEESHQSFSERLIQAEKLEEALVNNRKQQKVLQKQARALKEDLEVLRPKVEAGNRLLSDIKRDGEQIRVQLDDLQNKLVDLLGENTLYQAQSIWSQRKVDWTQAHEALEEVSKTTEKSYQDLVTRLATVRGQLVKDQGALALVEEDLLSALKESTFDNRQAVEAHVLSPEKQKEMAEAIQHHKQQMAIFKSREKDLSEKLGSRRVTADQLSQVKEESSQAEKAYRELHQRVATLIEQVKQKREDLKTLSSILERLSQVRSVRAVLDQILKLIKGNRFVEFVAMRHLRYIALEASDRLMDITSHRYSLELDDKGNFIICDHYSGGVRRDTNTLSGGETFLAALSLSLALSSQIQLKGKSTLEFFFLDEGFGTLDHGLLDIVMSSLEKLWNEQMAVGIITHVEELKNRVPIQLVVEPAIAGVKGTTTKIEMT